MWSAPRLSLGVYPVLRICITSWRYHKVTQHRLIIIFHPKDITIAKATTERCVEDVRAWMVNNRLKLNDDKTDVLLIQSRHREQTQLESIRIGDSHIVPKQFAGNLGATFDKHFLFDKHISTIARSMNYQITCVGRVRKYLTQEAAKTYIHTVGAYKKICLFPITW